MRLDSTRNSAAISFSFSFFDIWNSNHEILCLLNQETMMVGIRRGALAKNEQETLKFICFSYFSSFSLTLCANVFCCSTGRIHTRFLLCVLRKNPKLSVSNWRERGQDESESKNIYQLVYECGVCCGAEKERKVYEKCEKCGKLEGMGKSFRNNSQSCYCRFPSFIKMGTRIQYLMKKYSLSHSRLLRHFKTNRRQ